MTTTERAMIAELLPCPFCGSDKVMLRPYDNDTSGRIVCHGCGATGPLGSECGWINDAWNRRAEASKQSEKPDTAQDERAWRVGWAMAYSGADNLYGDDGELQDNRWPNIDWMRDSAAQIREKIYRRAIEALAKAQENA